jgi:predicted nucleic-acid-binding protein
VRAIDTNIVVRFVMNDDAERANRVRNLVSSNTLFLPITVVLEVEWVLRSVFGLDRTWIVAAVRKFIAIENVHVQHEAEVSRALDYAAGGMDLADAFHIALSVGCADFVSFDRPLSRKASILGTMPVAEP